MSNTKIVVEEIENNKIELLREVGRLRLEVWRGETDVNESLFPDDLWLEPLDFIARHWAVRDRLGIVASARLTIHDVLSENPDGYLFERAKISVPVPAGHLCKLVVHKRARGRGLATELNRVRIEAAKEMGAKSIIVTASDSNSRLLERVGFVDTGIREYFPNRPGYEFKAMQLSF